MRGTTDGINLVAQSYGRSHVGPGDAIVISAMEHHSNLVPWQMLCEEKGAELRIIPTSDAGELDLAAYGKLLDDRTRLVSVVHVSNALGTINPIEEMVRLAHGRGIPVLVDGAQAVVHMAVDVQALGCDFYALSGHKMLGPTGIGALYAAAPLLEAMPPYQSGGDMISSVTFERTLYNLRLTNSRRAPRTSPESWALARSLISTRSGSMGLRPTSTNCWSTPRARCRGFPGSG